MLRVPSKAAGSSKRRGKSGRAETGPNHASQDGAHTADIGFLDDWIGFHLRMAQIAAFQSFERHVGSDGLSPGRFTALALIDRNPGINQTALSRAIGSDKSTLTPLLDDLLQRGLISRDRTPADRRLYRLTLTDAGREILSATRERAQAHEAVLDAIVEPHDRAQFMNALRKISATRA